MNQKETVDPIIEAGVGLLPYQRVLVVLTGTELDTCVLRYLCMLEDTCSAGPTGGIRGIANHTLSSRVQAGYLRLRESKSIQAGVCPAPGSGKAPFVFFYSLQRGNRRALMELVVKQRIDLILVGRSSHESESMPISSVVRHLALRAACPVWIVPDTAKASKVQNIIVPMDFGTSCAEAAEVASILAEAWRIPECLALHAYFQDSRFPSEQSAQALKEGKWYAFAECTSRIKRTAPWFKLHFEEGARVSTVIGSFARKRGADLIVLGTRQRSQYAAALRGSTTLETIESSRIPVLVVKSGQGSSFFREILTAVLRPKDVLQTA